MCGIAGFVNFRSPQVDGRALVRMTDEVAYRGPDDFGAAVFGTLEKSLTWPEEKVHVQFQTSGPGVALAHRRLSIIDLRDEARQPMTYDRGRFWLTYNGEIYNYIELKKELKKLGCEFETESDSEVILAAYSKWGPDCVKKFNGMWGFAIFDSKKKSLFLSRDRYGIKPLYYFFRKDVFAFSSEIKQLFSLRELEAVADQESLEQFLAYGDVNTNQQACFKNVLQVEPGQNLSIDFESKEIKLSQYYELGEGAEGDNFDEIFESAIGLRLRSDVEVGSCLSGGIDSSLIVSSVASMAKNNSFQTFTSSFAGSKVDEWPFAEKVIESCGVKGNRIDIELGQIDEDLKKLVWHQEEPFRSTSIYAQWRVMRGASEAGVKVLLDGQGADEVFAGYHWFVPIYLGQQMKVMNWPGAFGNILRLRKNGILGASESAFKALMKSFYFAFSPPKRPEKAYMKLFPKNASAHQRAMDFPTSVEQGRRMEISQSLQSLLRHEDRNSMAFSIEARTPYLDYRLVEWALKLNERELFAGGWTKAPLRKKLNGSVPKEITWRGDKQGFATPEKEWMENTSEEMIKKLSEDEWVGNFLDQDRFKKSSSSLDRSFLWRLYSVSLWADAFKVNF